MTDGAASETAPTGNADVVPAQASSDGKPVPALDSPSSTTAAMAPSGAVAWLRLAHPRELAFGVAPAAVTLALIWSLGGRLRLVPALFTFVALLLVQAGAHVLDEYVEFERRKTLAGSMLWSAAGIDDHPLSVADTHPLLALRVGIALLAVGACAGIPLIATGGAPVVVLGVLGLAAAVLYSSTDYALKRLPGGELVVLLAFGPGIAVAAALAQQQRVTGGIAVAGVALGLLTLAYLLAGTLQTRDFDARLGRKSLAVIAGELVAKLIYVAAVVVAYVLTILIALPGGAGRGAVAVILSLPAAAIAVTGTARAQGAVARAATVRQTLRMHVLFALWLLIGLIVAGVLVRVLPHI